MKTFLLLLTVTFLVTGCAGKAPKSESTGTYGPQFKYSDLILKDYDEMSQMVNAKLKAARKVAGDDQETIEHLREATKLILSRPDSDNMVAKLMPELRKELSGYNAFEDVLSSIGAEAIAVANDSGAANGPQATSLVVLENLLSQIRPEVSNNADLRRIAEKVRDAKIEISDGVRNDMKLRGMFKPRNPSETAKSILKNAPAPKAKTKVKQDEE